MFSFFNGSASSGSRWNWFGSGGLFHGCNSPLPIVKNANDPKMYVAARIPNTICHCP